MSLYDDIDLPSSGPKNDIKLNPEPVQPKNEGKLKCQKMTYYNF